MIRAVTLDAGGTLVAPRDPVGTTYARIAETFGLAVDPMEVDARFRVTLRNAPPLAFPGTGAGDLAAFERAWWRAVVQAALGPGVAHPRFDACFEALFTYFARADAWTVFDDVAPALQAFRARGWRVGVVSNFDGRLPALLDALGIRPLDAIVWSSAAGAAKPARAIFETAAQRLGVALPELCHVGDEVEADVDGARAAGAVAVHLDRQAARPGSGSIATLTALTEQLDGMRYA